MPIDTLPYSPVRLKEHLESTLSQLTSENKSIFIMADFNINLLNCESPPESNDFLLMLNFFFFYLISYNQHVLLKDQPPSLIIYLQMLVLWMPSVVNLVSEISDHLTQFLIADNLKVNYKVLNYYKWFHTSRLSITDW